jgi:hypothetical protein
VKVPHPLGDAVWIRGLAPASPGARLWSSSTTAPGDPITVNLAAGVFRNLFGIERCKLWAVNQRGEVQMAQAAAELLHMLRSGYQVR